MTGAEAGEEAYNGILAAHQECHCSPGGSAPSSRTEGRLENFGNYGDDVEIRVWNHHRREYDARPDQAVPASDRGGGQTNADQATVAEFVRFARDGGATDTSILAGREAVATGYAATLSLWTGGGAVEVPRVGEPLVAAGER